MTPTTRRQFLAAGALGTAGVMFRITLQPAEATPAAMQHAIRQVVGDAPVKVGRVKLDMPVLVENGNVVPMQITVESPMTEEERVESIHVFNEKNPQPNVGTFRFGPRAGRASISTRIRLNDAQKVVAIAKFSDGSYWSATTEVVVTLAACVEGI
jgi:sulfur-oxidizing protein SoxY